MDSPQAAFALKPAGFLMGGVVIMLIATLPMLQIGGFTGTAELLVAMAIFCASAFIFNMGQVLKSIGQLLMVPIIDVKNAIRPLIPLIVIVIYFWTS